MRKEEEKVKRSIKMIALLLALALMAGGTLLAQKMTETRSVSETEGTFALAAQTAEEVTGLSWTHEGVTYHFVKQDGAWKNADDAAFPVNSDEVQELADDLAAMTATRKLEDVTEPANYGLAEPAATVTAEWADGSSTAYAMGAETPFGDGYYLSLSTEAGTVYTVEDALDDLFDKSAMELAALEEIPAVEDASRLVIGSALEIIRAEASVTIDEAQLWYTADGLPLNAADAEDLLDDAAAISWKELLSASASAEELAAWSLTGKTATAITLSNAEKTSTVLIGAADESGNYYARLPESSMVYTVASSKVSALLSADASGMRVADLMPLAYESVQEAQISANGSVFAFSGIPAGEAEAEETEAEAETPGKDLWTLIKALKADSFVQAAPQGDALLTITAANAAGMTETIAFYDYDAESYLVALGSGETALTDAAAVDQIIRTFKQLI